MTREYVQTKCDNLGVEFCHHADSTMMRVAGWYHSFRGNPLFSSSTYVTVYPYIFVPDGVSDPLNDWPVIDHELVHWVRQRDTGTIRWVLRYAVDIGFRESEERRAFLRDIKHNRLTVQQAAKRLRSPPYGVQTPQADLESWFNSQLAIRVPKRPNNGV